MVFLCYHFKNFSLKNSFVTKLDVNFIFKLFFSVIHLCTFRLQIQLLTLFEKD